MRIDVYAIAVVLRVEVDSCSVPSNTAVQSSEALAGVRNFHEVFNTVDHLFDLAWEYRWRDKQGSKFSMTLNWRARPRDVVAWTSSKILSARVNSNRKERQTFLILTDCSSFPSTIHKYIYMRKTLRPRCLCTIISVQRRLRSSHPVSAILRTMTYICYVDIHFLKLVSTDITFTVIYSFVLFTIVILIRLIYFVIEAWSTLSLSADSGQGRTCQARFYTHQYRTEVMINGAEMTPCKTFQFLIRNASPGMTRSSTNTPAVNSSP